MLGVAARIRDVRGLPEIIDTGMDPGGPEEPG